MSSTSKATTQTAALLPTHRSHTSSKAIMIPTNSMERISNRATTTHNRAMVRQHTANPVHPVVQLKATVDLVRPSWAAQAAHLLATNLEAERWAP
jgi:hypothetical protein